MMNADFDDDMLDADELDLETQQLFAEAGVTANPKDYYFKAEQMPNEDLGQTMVTICPKKYFDAEGHLFDQHLSLDAGGLLDLGDRFEELQEAMFGFDGSVAQAEKILTKRGMTLNSKLT